MSKKLWTEEELEFLQQNYEHLGAKEVASILNRSISSINSKANRLNFKKRISWTVEEDNFLIESYPTNGIKFCAEALNRTEYAITNRTRKLSLRSLTVNLNSKKILDTWLESNTDIILLEPFSNVLTKLKVTHTLCGHIWHTTVDTIKASRKKGYVGCPKCSCTCTYSKIAIEWLNSFNNPNIQHAENGGEVYLLNKYRVDGFDSTTNTVYEFHGDVFHGNLDIFHPNYRCHPFDKAKTAEELWDSTYTRMEELSKYYTVIYIWENDYKNGKHFEIF